jgi:hypothetical protein
LSQLANTKSPNSVTVVGITTFSNDVNLSNDEVPKVSTVYSWPFIVTVDGIVKSDLVEKQFVTVAFFPDTKYSNSPILW